MQHEVFMRAFQEIVGHRFPMNLAYITPDVKTDWTIAFGDGSTVFELNMVDTNGVSERFTWETDRAFA